MHSKQCGCRNTPQDGEQVVSLTGETLCVKRAPSEEAIEAALAPVYNAGIRAIAVVLKHSALYPDHELLVGKVASRLGFTHVSLSSQVRMLVLQFLRSRLASAQSASSPVQLMH